VERENTHPTATQECRVKCVSEEELFVNCLKLHVVEIKEMAFEISKVICLCLRAAYSMQLGFLKLHESSNLHMSPMHYSFIKGVSMLRIGRRRASSFVNLIRADPKSIVCPGHLIMFFVIRLEP
jgi:hypothetical protein